MHDVINNSVSPHHSNTGNPYPIQELLDILIILMPVLKAIVYTPRDSTQDLKKQLISTGILILDAKKDLISTRKAKTSFYQQELAEDHLDEEVEAELLITVIKGAHDFRKLIKKRKKNGEPTSYHLKLVSI